MISTSLDAFATVIYTIHLPHRHQQTLSLRLLPLIPAHSVTMVIVDQYEYLSEEEKRLKDDRERKKYWKKW